LKAAAAKCSVVLAALLAFFVLTVPAAADGELARARAAKDKFFQNLQSHKRSEWLSLIKQFEEAASVQPRIEPAAKGRFLAAELSWDSFERFGQKADAVKAGELARQVVKNCSRCPDSPGALLILGRSLIARDKLDEAYRELMKVELNYQGAPEVSQARRLMATLAGHPLPSEGGGGNADKAPRENSGSKGAPAVKPSAATPPVARPAPKRPTPRADAKNQLYALFLDDRGTYSEITAYLERVSPYLYNLLPPARDGGRFRVYVDFKDAKLSSSAPASLKNSTSLVKLVKVNQLNDNTVRLVADLPEAYPYTPIFLDDPPRLIIRVASEPSFLPPVEAEAPPSLPPAPDPPKKKDPPPSQVRPTKGPSDSMARQLGLKIRRVVIDPGHGGKDGGAAGNGLKEKDIVLSVAKKLAEKIRSGLGLEVILTRETDKFVTLDRRTKIALDNRADLFISIHVNANDLAKVEGFETYILNFSNNPTALAVASRENAVADKTMSEINDLLQVIAKNTKVAESRVLAKAVHSGALSSLRSKYKIRDLGVKEAAFVVLAGLDVPSVLVEIGFITNKSESERLTQESYQELLTQGLYNGLKAYLDGLP
jgi:N-acetylmuramoyl-L-alanine amidase